MKKTLAVVLCALLLVSSLSVIASAWGSAAVGANIKLDIKKATVDFKADGVITEGEYYELPVTKDMLAYAAPGEEDEELATKAKHIGDTAKFYMSWNDDGVNIAVTYKPDDLMQTLMSAWAGGDQDGFCNNTGLQASFASQQNDGVRRNEWYGAIGKTTDPDELADTSIAGMYNGMFCGAWQTGLGGEGEDGYFNGGYYSSAANGDFIVVYPGDGSVLYEWHMPFRVFTTNTTEGSKIYISLGLCSGSDEYAISWSAAYVCGLGDNFFFGPTVAEGQQRMHAEYTLVGAPAVDTPDTPDTPDEPVNPPTMDITLVLLAVASVSAVVVAKKRK